MLLLFTELKIANGAQKGVGIPGEAQFWSSTSAKQKAKLNSNLPAKLRLQLRQHCLVLNGFL